MSSSNSFFTPGRIPSPEHMTHRENESTEAVSLSPMSTAGFPSHHDDNFGVINNPISPINSELMSTGKPGNIQNANEIKNLEMNINVKAAVNEALEKDPVSDADGQNKKLPKTFKVFEEVTAVLSEQILAAIPGSQSALFKTIQSDYDVKLSLGNQRETDESKIYIMGNLDSLSKVEKRLGTVCGRSEDLNKQDNGLVTAGGDAENFEKIAKASKPEMTDKSVSCELLMPTISQRGRVIKSLRRYNGYISWNSLPEFDDHDDHPYGKRQRKMVQSKSTIKQSSSDALNVDSPENPASSSASDFKDEEDRVKPEDVMDEDESKDTERVSATSFLNDNTVDRTMDRSDSLITDYASKKKRDYESLAPFKYFCPSCSFRTKRESHFNIHKRLHEKQVEQYRCKKCNFSSLRLSHLRRHEASHTSPLLMCYLCSYKTYQSNLLNRHLKTKHDPNKPPPKPKPILSCPSCKYKTTKQFYFKRHLSTHPELVEDSEGRIVTKGLKMFICDQCPYKAARKEGLLRHKANIHSNKRPYLCDLCGKAFKRTDALAQHKETHLEKPLRSYPFKCPNCRKSFRTQAHLNEHVDSHSIERSYLCYICGTSFKTKSTQRKHMQTIHLNPGAYQCENCQKKFNTNFALKRHRRTHMVVPPANAAARGDSMAHIVSHMHTVAHIVPHVDTAVSIGAEVTAATEQIQVQDVILPPVGEVYGHSGEAIHQAFIQTDKGPSLLYLSGFTAFQDAN